MRKQRPNAFTLAETIIVLAVTATIMGVMMVVYLSFCNQFAISFSENKARAALLNSLEQIEMDARQSESIPATTSKQALTLVWQTTTVSYWLVPYQASPNFALWRSTQTGGILIHQGIIGDGFVSPDTLFTQRQGVLNVTLSVQAESPSDSPIFTLSSMIQQRNTAYATQ
jgi:type II secretory pathway pseudopilin PulG